MDTINPITKMTGVTYSDLARWSSELDKEINSLGFHGKPFPYRAGVQRFRTAIDQLAAAMRGIDEGVSLPYYDAHIMKKIYRDPRFEVV